MNIPDSTTTSQWRKATYSNGQGACLEVGHVSDHIKIRDTAQAAMGNLRTVLGIAPDTWTTFTESVRQQMAYKTSQTL